MQVCGAASTKHQRAPPPLVQLVGLGRADDNVEDSSNSNSSSSKSAAGTSSAKHSSEAKDKEADVDVDEGGWGIPAAAGKVCRGWRTEV